jgi:UDP-glucose:glycoprotein glucosyltransferase
LPVSKFGPVLFFGTKELFYLLWDLDIGLKASQYIAISENPLLTMEQLSQDFPKYAKRISKIDVNSVFEEEITENQMGSLQGGMSAVWINGKPLEDNQIDPFL